MKILKRGLEIYEMIALLPLALLIIACVIVGIFSTFMPKHNSNEPYYIRTNSIGCDQYEYKGDRFWKCPEHSGITQIEAEYLNGKYYDKKIEPVIK